MKTIFINHQPVELYKILKFESLVDGGGEAKMAIANGMVLLNGEVETQKRKQVNAGDIIEFDGESFKLALDDGSNKASHLAQASHPAKAKKSTSQAQQAVTPAEPVVKKPKRTAIRF
ncbi:MAG: ribosome-associated protein [Alteromonadaceae bacterium]|jgi:ribosome-associated protein